MFGAMLRLEAWEVYAVVDDAYALARNEPTAELDVFKELKHVFIYRAKISRGRCLQ